MIVKILAVVLLIAPFTLMVGIPGFGQRLLSGFVGGFPIVNLMILAAAIAIVGLSLWFAAGDGHGSEDNS